MAKESSRRRSEAGYNLVVMVIVITAFNVIVASAWPLWSAFAQREREEELIFRGLQYAEAIRVFQKRFGRYPNRLEELVELEPRCIRQLWDDPMSEDGKWGLIFGAAPAAAKGKGGPKGRGGTMAEIINERRNKAAKDGRVESPVAQNPGGAPGSQRPGSSSGPRRQGKGKQMAAGPISGVFSKSEGSGFKTFFGQTSYGEWRFDVSLVNQPPMGPNGVRTPHIGPRTLGKAFRGDISGPGGGMPGGSPKGRPGAAKTPAGAGG